MSVRATLKARQVNVKAVVQLIEILFYNQHVTDTRRNSAEDSIKFRCYPLRHVTVR